MVSKVLDEIDQSHMSMVRITDKLLHPPRGADNQRKLGEGEKRGSRKTTGGKEQR